MANYEPSLICDAGEGLALTDHAGGWRAHHFNWDTTKSTTAINPPATANPISVLC